MASVEHPDGIWKDHDGICGASVNISEGSGTILMASWVHLEPTLAASGSILEAWEHIRSTKSGFWDTLEPPLTAGEGSPTPFEIPCGLRMNILQDVRSGIEGFRGGRNFGRIRNI